MLGDPKGWRAPLLSHVPGPGGAPDYLGFYTGISGDGPSARLDPRFSVSRDPLADRAYGQLSRLAGEDYVAPEEALEGALRAYEGQQSASLGGTLQHLKGAGRGLRASDEEAIRERTREKGVEDRAALNELFERLATAGAVQGAQRRESLIGSIPGLDLQRARADSANADRLLQEQEAFGKYKTDAYGAKIQQNMSDDLAAAAG